MTTFVKFFFFFFFSFGVANAAPTTIITPMGSFTVEARLGFHSCTFVAAEGVFYHPKREKAQVQMRLWDRAEQICNAFNKVDPLASKLGDDVNLVYRERAALTELLGWRDELSLVAHEYGLTSRLEKIGQRFRRLQRLSAVFPVEGSGFPLGFLRLLVLMVSLVSSALANPPRGIVVHVTAYRTADHQAGWYEDSLFVKTLDYYRVQGGHLDPLVLWPRYKKARKAFDKVWKGEEAYKRLWAWSVCLKETWCGLTTTKKKWGRWKFKNSNGTWDCGITQINSESTEHTCSKLNKSDELAFREQKRILVEKVLQRRKKVNKTKERPKKCPTSHKIRVNGQKVCPFQVNYVSYLLPSTEALWWKHIGRYNGRNNPKYIEEVRAIYMSFLE